MEFNFKKNGNTIIVYLKGRLDVHHCADIEQEISKLLSYEMSSHLLFNMKDVEYISSSGLRIIVSTMKRLNEENRNMAICNINNSVKKIFEIVQLTDMFNIFSSEDDAFNFLKMI